MIFKPACLYFHFVILERGAYTRINTATFEECKLKIFILTNSVRMEQMITQRDLSGVVGHLQRFRSSS